MKQHPVRILTCALLAFGTSLISTPSYGQDAKAPPALSAAEKAAIASYTKSMKEGEKLASENTPNDANPAAAMEMMDKMEKILDSTKTEGLPKDLNTAFEAFRGSMKKMLAHVNKMPIPKALIADPVKLQPWIAEQTAANPKFPQELQEKMGKFQEGMQTIAADGDKHKESLTAMHKKYAIDVDLEAGNPAKKAKPGAESPKGKTE